MAAPRQPLLPLDAAAIPEALKANKRWAPWRAVWNEKRQKYDKIPCHPQGYGLSTAKPERWLSFDAALAALKAKPDLFAGLGYVMTGPHGLVGIDLDNCVSDGTVAPWAADIVQDCGSYAEVSPSGKGVRIVCHGDVPADWTNHDVGAEVYGGHAPRFLSFTGQVLGDRHDVTRPDASVLAQLAQRYARERTAATVISLTMPDVLDELVLPDLAALDLPYQARDFLVDGTTRGDRSRELFAAAVALFGAGLGEAEVFSVLATNSHAMDVALDHRRQDHDRALMYLWVEHAQKAKGRATSKLATLDDFEDVSEAPAPVMGTAAPATKPQRYVIQQAAVFSREKPIVWAIKRLLPYADLGVVYGESGAGKSFFVLDLVLCLATGKPWRDRPVQQGAVLYVCAEGAGGFRARLQAYAEFHGIDLAAVPLYILGDAPNIMEKADLKDLIAAAKAIGVPFRTVVMDTLAQITPGANENSGEDMGRALAHCKTLGQTLAAMTLLVAHAGKDASRGQRGWSGIKGALDVEILVERSGEHRAASVTKMKDGQGEGDEYGFKLHTVTLGQDEDGDDITSCVIEAVGALPKAQRKGEPKGVWQQTVLRVAQGMTDLPGDVTTVQLIDAAVNEMPAEEGKRDQRRKNAMRAVESLVAANRLSTAGGTVNVL